MRFMLRMGKHATYSPAFLPVPKSAAKEFEKMISMAEVILLIAEV
jgi:hypothetical protein